MARKNAQAKPQRLQFTLLSLFVLQLLVAIVLIVAEVAPRFAVEVVTVVLAFAYARWRHRHQDDEEPADSKWSRVSDVGLRVIGVTAGAAAGFIVASLIALFVGQVQSIADVLWFGRLGSLVGAVTGAVFPNFALNIVMLCS